MNEKDINRLLKFLDPDKQMYVDLLVRLLSRLSLEVDFKLKIQKASIQLIHQLPFAVIGFRKSKDYLLVEFYDNAAIEDERIVKRTVCKESMIIKTIHVTFDAEIDDAIINWIRKSFELVIKHK